MGVIKKKTTVIRNEVLKQALGYREVFNMDEKKVNGNEFQPENAGTNPEPNNNTENINAKPEEQSTQRLGIF